MIDACRLAACRESLPENGDRYGYLQVEKIIISESEDLISYEAADMARKAPTILNFQKRLMKGREESCWRQVKTRRQRKWWYQGLFSLLLVTRECFWNWMTAG